MQKPAKVTPCPACGSEDVNSAALVTEARYHLLCCGRCRSEFFVDQSDTGKDTQSHYKWESYKLGVYRDEAVRHGFETRYGEMLLAARSKVGQVESVLDIGCGIGNFLDFAERQGLTAVGSDVSLRAVEEARARGLQAYLADDLQSSVQDESFDALTFWDVIEHVDTPVDMLSSVIAKVRPGGALLFETPDGGFPVRTILLRLNQYSRGRLNLTGPMYYWEHKVYLTEAGIRALLHSVGADVVDVRRVTSVRAKMQREFAVKRSTKGAILRWTWPLLELIFRRTGQGNKLLVIARRRS